MGKPKGRSGKGKYEQGLDLHVKAVRGQKGPFLDITVRLTEENVRKNLLPQIQKFLRELDRQSGLRMTKAVRAGN